MLVTDRKTDYFEKRAGGTGTTIMEHIIDEKVYNGKIAAYARVILKPGCSLVYFKRHRRIQRQRHGNGAVSR